MAKDQNSSFRGCSLRQLSWTCRQSWVHVLEGPFGFLERHGGGGGRTGESQHARTLVSLCAFIVLRFLSGSWHLGHMVSLVQKGQLEQEGKVIVLLLRTFVQNQLWQESGRQDTLHHL